MGWASFLTSSRQTLSIKTPDPFLSHAGSAPPFQHGLVKLQNFSKGEISSHERRR